MEKMSTHTQNNSYTNPAFCQKSELYGSQQRCTSPQRKVSVRHSPVGALTTHHILDTSIRSVQAEPMPPRPGPKPKLQCYEEQDFYEEMVLDHNGAVQEKKLVVIHNDSKRYESIPQEESTRYPPEQYGKRPVKTRYEYIPLQEQDVVPVQRITSPVAQRRVQYHEEVEASTGIVHRYAVTPGYEEPPKPSGRYALVPVEEVPNTRYAVVTQEEMRPSHRYEYIDEGVHERSPPRKVLSPQPPRRVANPAATQKLHEILSTPRKPVHQVNAPRNPPGRSSSFSSPPRRTPKAQQKLNYTIGTRQPSLDKRNTAIVAPICSSPVQSVYSETTYSKDSWMSGKKPPVQATLTAAAFMMVLCGGVTTGLCFYMISFMGRLYFLDFGAVAGFTCLLLGLLGFRSRNVYWLPNRNYISGYFILSVFSLLTCAGLLVLLVVRPKPGTPLADMTSGAVCGISGLSLLLAGSGVVASYCCKVPPPDNRVQHCAPGFSV